MKPLPHYIQALVISSFIAIMTLHVSAEQFIGDVQFDTAEQDGSQRHEDPRDLAIARQGGPDTDGDGQDDYEDNCSLVANANQLDTDADGFGNRCDTDLNNDQIVNLIDLSILSQAFFSTPLMPNWNGNADFNGDNVVNWLDLAAFRDAFLGSPGPSGMACAGQAPCPAPQLLFAWPMPGNDADDWVINNYVDLDPGVGVTDFAGGAKSYNGHRGIDIDVPTFRSMDNDFPILAVAQGTVLAFVETNFDRNTSCTGSWNFVTVGHPNGFKTIYGHLKRESVVVNVGDTVQPGTVLGVVGSSGCSTAPHLHLETVDENGFTVEPFANGMWLNPPVYDTLIGFMDATLYDTAINSVNMIKDPPANISSIDAGATFGIGLSMGGGDTRDSVNLRLLNASGSIIAQNNINWPNVLRHSYWWWNYNIPVDASGAHTLQIRVNNVLKASYAINVTSPTLTGYTQVRHGVPSADYQTLFNLLTANGYRPIWVDGYQVGGSTFFNAIFNKSVVTSWSSAHNLTVSGYQTYFTAQTQAGRRLVHVDSYRVGNTIRYAPIFVQQIGTQWLAYHNLTTAQHQANFNSYAAQGYRASHISFAEDSSGTLRVTALYDKNPVGGWVALANMTSSQYQTNFTTQTSAGRVLSYLNVYSVNGSPRFSAVWNSIVPTAWVARHNLSSAEFQSNFDTWTSQGLSTRFITGYDNGSGSQNFGGFWSN